MTQNLVFLRFIFRDGFEKNLISESLPRATAGAVRPETPLGPRKVHSTCRKRQRERADACRAQTPPAPPWPKMAMPVCHRCWRTRTGPRNSFGHAVRPSQGPLPDLKSPARQIFHAGVSDRLGAKWGKKERMLKRKIKNGAESAA